MERATTNTVWVSPTEERREFHHYNGETLIRVERKWRCASPPPSPPPQPTQRLHWIMPGLLRGLFTMAICVGCDEINNDDEVSRAFVVQFRVCWPIWSETVLTLTVLDWRTSGSDVCVYRWKGRTRTFLWPRPPNSLVFRACLTLHKGNIAFGGFLYITLYLAPEIMWFKFSLVCRMLFLGKF